MIEVAKRYKRIRRTYTKFFDVTSIVNYNAKTEIWGKNGKYIKVTLYLGIPKTIEPYTLPNVVMEDSWYNK